VSVVTYSDSQANLEPNFFLETSLSSH